MLRSRSSWELLFVRKSYRPGFEGNGQLAFPGGMIRGSERRARLESWIHASLTVRVAAEVNLDLPTYGKITPLKVIPPIVAAYTAKGRRWHTVILPFTLSLTQDFRPWSQDSTVHDPGWRTPLRLWSEITPTNRLIAAYYLWPRLSDRERTEAQPYGAAGGCVKIPSDDTPRSTSLLSPNNLTIPSGDRQGVEEVDENVGLKNHKIPPSFRPKL